MCIDSVRSLFDDSDGDEAHGFVGDLNDFEELGDEYVQIVSWLTSLPNRASL